AQDGTDRELTVELWGTGAPENAVPADHLLTTTVTVPSGGPHWVTARLGHRPDTPRNAVLIVRACADTALVLLPERTDGVLALRRKAEGDAAVD
ncbi:FAD-dependent oxidoreductase, partial [Streptomyces sp. DT225]